MCVVDTVNIVHLHTQIRTHTHVYTYMDASNGSLPIFSYIHTNTIHAERAHATTIKYMIHDTSDSLYIQRCECVDTLGRLSDTYIFPAECRKFLIKHKNSPHPPPKTHQTDENRRTRTMAKIHTQHIHSITDKSFPDS